MASSFLSLCTALTAPSVVPHNPSCMLRLVVLITFTLFFGRWVSIVFLMGLNSRTNPCQSVRFTATQLVKLRRSSQCMIPVQIAL
mmetsp:Transcript_12521/g.18004  ORF Transcript_12521/g.18004 Transcript_12521/m.18004 type:complete len:85 (+) Transcript_12521:409-663(+)